MASVLISGDTSGSITISAPSISGTNTLTLPVATDTLVGKATTDTLTNKSIVATQLTGTVAAARLPAGSVLQVVSTTKTDTFTSTTTGSFLDVTGLSVAITPASASNKVMVFGRITGMGTSAVTRAQMRLVRDSIAISVGDAASARLQVSGNEMYVADPDVLLGSTVFFLDSPATTAATTYKLQLRNGNSAGTIYVNRNPTDTDSAIVSRGTSSITVMEIAG